MSQSNRITSFRDFDLRIERASDGSYRARLSNSPAGPADAPFVAPVLGPEMENVLFREGGTRRLTRSARNSESAAAREFGGRLFNAVFDGDVRACLRSSLDEATRDGVGLRIRLWLSETPELNDLPWEFILNPRLNRFLALSDSTPVVRYLEVPERVRRIEVEPPLRILAVISSPPSYPQLDVEKEWQKLEESIRGTGRIVLERRTNPTTAELEQWLQSEVCHVLHFIGHGDFDQQSDKSVLLFCDDEKRAKPVDGGTLGTLLHNHRSLRLAVLNACEGARTSLSNPFAGVAQGLIQCGIPAVIAMQFEITDAAAIKFSQGLYSALAAGRPVDAALVEARNDMFSAGHELEWGTPVLYMRAPDGQIFDPEKASPDLGPKRRQ